MGSSHGRRSAPSSTRQDAKLISMAIGLMFIVLFLQLAVVYQGCRVLPAAAPAPEPEISEWEDGTLATCDRLVCIQLSDLERGRSVYLYDRETDKNHQHSQGMGMRKMEMAT
jgi:hypothetical protein